MKIEIRHQTCHLLAERAVFWEEQHTLILADMHMGKATHFQKEGISVPEGSWEEDLQRVTTLIQKFQPRMCVIVGDLIHTSKGLSSQVKMVFSHWLQACECEIHLVLGNHDFSLAKNLPSEWPLHIHREGLLLDPFYFSHHPLRHAGHFVWAGHLHPKVEIKNAHDRLVLRCFQIFPHLAILPAFGSFVGGTFVKKTQGGILYAIADSCVIPL